MRSGDAGQRMSKMTLGSQRRSSPRREPPDETMSNRFMRLRPSAKSIPEFVLLGLSILRVITMLLLTVR